MEDAASLTLFVKRPTPGTVKTRLAAAIGAHAATAFYVACAEHAVDAVAATPGGRVTVAYAPADAGDDVARWLAPRLAGRDAAFEAQCDGGDLGARMQAALARGLTACGKVRGGRGGWFVDGAPPLRTCATRGPPAGGGNPWATKRTRHL